jgi:hypothetical protein
MHRTLFNQPSMETISKISSSMAGSNTPLPHPLLNNLGITITTSSSNGIHVILNNRAMDILPLHPSNSTNNKGMRGSLCRGLVSGNGHTLCCQQQLTIMILLVISNSSN